jgi:hypothetical protein
MVPYKRLLARVEAVHMYLDILTWQKITTVAQFAPAYQLAPNGGINSDLEAKCFHMVIGREDDFDFKEVRPCQRVEMKMKVTHPNKRHLRVSMNMLK